MPDADEVYDATRLFGLKRLGLLRGSFVSSLSPLTLSLRDCEVYASLRTSVTHVA